MTEREPLSAYVQPELTAKRLDAQWARLAQRESSFREAIHAPWLRAGALGAAAALLCTGLYVGLGQNVGGRGVGAAPKSSQQAGPSTVEFGQDIAAMVSQGSNLSLVTKDEHETRLLLSRGVATFDVTHRDGRRVVIATPGYEIEVVGTRFTVSVDGAATPKSPATRATSNVSVEVSRGVVQISQVNGTAQAGDSERRSAGKVRRVVPGISWDSREDPNLEQGQEVAPPSTEAPSNTVASAAPPPAAPQHLQARASAKDLFEDAERARVAGRAADAAASLDALCKNYPGDRRTALASFELGRLRMDALRDPAGALQAFHTAIRLSPGGAFREDAEARIVQLYERLGKRDACRQAQLKYLAAFPSGLHKNVVGAACAR